MKGRVPVPLRSPKNTSIALTSVYRVNHSLFFLPPFPVSHNILCFRVLKSAHGRGASIAKGESGEGTRLDYGSPSHTKRAGCPRGSGGHSGEILQVVRRVSRKRELHSSFSFSDPLRGKGLVYLWGNGTTIEWKEEGRGKK